MFDFDRDRKNTGADLATAAGAPSQMAAAEIPADTDERLLRMDYDNQPLAAASPRQDGEQPTEVGGMVESSSMTDDEIRKLIDDYLELQSPNIHRDFANVIAAVKQIAHPKLTVDHSTTPVNSGEGSKRRVVIYLEEQNLLEFNIAITLNQDGSLPTSSKCGFSTNEVKQWIVDALKERTRS